MYKPILVAYRLLRQDEAYFQCCIAVFNISVLQGQQYYNTVTSYFRGKEQLRKLSNLVQSKALTYIT
jgi:hypothetical protein